MPFEIELMNLGKAMDLESGKFTAPKNGVYVFTFNGVKVLKAGKTGIFLQRNGKENIARGYGTKTDSEGFYTIVLQCIVQLRQGDHVNLVLESGAIHDDWMHYSHFTGSLVEEDFM